MPEIDPLQLILAELREVKETANEAYGISKELKQTLHGPPGSNNGLYKSVQKLSTKMDEGFAEINGRIDTDIMPIIRDAKRGMSLREKMWLIVVAAVTSGLVGIGVSLLQMGGS